MSLDHALGKVHVLTPAVIGRIAAGEVIERPAAVVKELIENSLDAGSTSITVDIKDGGLGYIRVIDNGEGMIRPDVMLAFDRHATSKLQSDTELDAIQTLGFRGEALPSIAAVSRVQVTTSARDDTTGTHVSITGGQMNKVDTVAAVPGTRIEVADLFFNTPARRKFLKSPTTEFSHISHTVHQACLAWPQVHFRLVHNGNDVLNCAAVSRQRDRVLQIYREAFVDRTLEIQVEEDGLGIKGFIVDPVRARATKAPQDLFVNRRPIKNATVFHALSDGYRAFLAKGHHPVFVLFLDVNSRRIDVNVHPTKREIRFSDAETIHRAVRSAVRDTLGLSSMGLRGSHAYPERHVEHRQAEASPSVCGPMGETWERLAEGTEVQVSRDPVSVAEQTSMIREVPEPYLSVSQIDVVPLGQMSRTFLIAQVGAELHVVDQHTAHERVLFERLWKNWRDRLLIPQPLLLPEPFEMSAQKADLLRHHLNDLEAVGLSVEPFGSSSFLIRAVPLSLTHADAEAVVQDLIDDLDQWASLSSLEERIKPILASLACHGAVRAGRLMALPEIKRVIEDWVQEGRIMTCPHGRRVAFRLSADELARMFNRT
ncbi:MAG: DNA mismatch repair endonuclease MutL [Nitrospiraceae bacterium]